MYPTQAGQATTWGAHCTVRGRGSLARGSKRTRVTPKVCFDFA
jgi:hypothetical protein